jgi:CBS domain containing-hemolysin-like protein
VEEMEGHRIARVKIEKLENSEANTELPKQA